MDNNQIKFDPMTGQPINNTVVNNVQPTPTTTQVNQQTIQPATVINSNVNSQQQMQNIPNVEQSKQEFIDNTQANNIIKKDKKNNEPNITFIIILFAIIFAAMFFLFPYLLKVL